MGEQNTKPRRINKVEGAAGQVMICGGPAVLETYGAPAPAAHVHAAGDVTSGQFLLTRMPRGTAGHVITGQGAGVDPVYATVAAATLTVAETEVFAGNTPGAAAWTDLDLSGTIGANVAVVMLKFVGTGAAGAGVVAFRKNGDADEHWNVAAAASAGGTTLIKTPQNIFMEVIVATDATGKVEWKAELLGVACTIDIVAYIK